MLVILQQGVVSNKIRKSKLELYLQILIRDQLSFLSWDHQHPWDIPVFFLSIRREGPRLSQDLKHLWLNLSYFFQIFCGGFEVLGFVLDI